MAYPVKPNDLLRAARTARRSPSGSNRVLSRQELAEAVNAHIYATTGRVVEMDGRYIANLERGGTRWPSKIYRAGLRAVLEAERDADLGLYIAREAMAEPLAKEPEAPATSTHTQQATVDMLRPAASLAAVGGTHKSAEVAAVTPATVQVNVFPGAAVTVACNDSQPEQVVVAVGAGPLRVVISAAAGEAKDVLTPLVESTSSVGARIYSISNRKAQ